MTSNTLKNFQKSSILVNFCTGSALSQIIDTYVAMKALSLMIIRAYAETLRFQTPASSSKAASYAGSFNNGSAHFPTNATQNHGFLPTVRLPHDTFSSAHTTALAAETLRNGPGNHHHLESSSSTRILRCTCCNKVCLSNAAMKRHMRTHTGERPYPCPECSYAARQRYDLTRHISALHAATRSHLSS